MPVSLNMLCVYSGHYISDVYCPSDSIWNSYNDSKMTPVSRHIHIHKHIYVVRTYVHTHPIARGILCCIYCEDIRGGG